LLLSNRLLKPNLEIVVSGIEKCNLQDEKYLGKSLARGLNFGCERKSVMLKLRWRYPNHTITPKLSYHETPRICG